MKYFLIVLILSLAQPTFAAQSGERTPHIPFLVLSDIHFDPFLTCRHVKKHPCPFIMQLTHTSPSAWPAILQKNHDKTLIYHEDTDYALLHATLVSAKKEADSHHVAFVLVLGDLLGHNFQDHYQAATSDTSATGYQTFVKKVFVFLTDELHTTFQNHDTYLLFGNNDGDQGDYRVMASPFYAWTGELWRHLTQDTANQTMMMTTFKAAGYYAFNIQNTQLRLIMLNTVLFSNRAKGERVDETTNQELHWLARELALTKKQNKIALIAMHIPEGFNLYTASGIPFFQLTTLWRPDCITRFEAILSQSKTPIVAVFSGHVHADWYAIKSINHINTPFFGIPSISPIFGNNPAYKIYQYSTNTGKIDNVTTFQYPFLGH